MNHFKNKTNMFILVNLIILQFLFCCKFKDNQNDTDIEKVLLFNSDFPSNPIIGNLAITSLEKIYKIKFIIKIEQIKNIFDSTQIDYIYKAYYNNSKLTIHYNTKENRFLLLDFAFLDKELYLKNNIRIGMSKIELMKKIPEIKNSNVNTYEIVDESEFSSIYLEFDNNNTLKLISFKDHENQ